MPLPIQVGGAGVDLSPRLYHSSAVVASPAAASETIIASVTISQDVAAIQGIYVFGYAAFLIGASGVSANLRIRRTDTSGTIVKASGATTVTAADLRSASILGRDTGITPLNQVYVMTLTIGSGAAESTVSAVTLVALVV